jgi:hypothetical protein
MNDMPHGEGPWMPRRESSVNDQNIMAERNTGPMVIISSDLSEKAISWRKSEEENLLEIITTRVSDRKKRTRPKRRAAADKHSSMYEFALLDESRKYMPPADPILSPDIKKLYKVAKWDELCGANARNASLSNPHSFHKRDVLNSKSRVLITGILSNPIAFNLALSLSHRCGVKVIMGIDSMYPNSILHRLEWQRRIQILTREIPKLDTPIVMPFLGLDPKLNEKKATKPPKKESKIPVVQEATGEANLLKFRPTHIVHLASTEPHAYIDDDAIKNGRQNAECPYNTETRAPPLFQIRQSSASMEQILASITSAMDEKTKPHFSYGSSHEVLHGIGSSTEAKQSSGREDFHAATKLADEILASAYEAQSGVYSVGVRFPSSVYGPWGSNGSQEYKLVEAAVRYWQWDGQKKEKEKSKGSKWNDKQDTIIGLAGLSQATNEVRDYLFVDGKYYH